MSKKEIQIVVMLELVAPEHKEKAIIKDKSERDEVFKLYKEALASKDANPNWEKILSPISDDTTRTKFIDLFNVLEKEDSANEVLNIAEDLLIKAEEEV